MSIPNPQQGHLGTVAEPALSASDIDPGATWPLVRRGLISRVYPILTELWQLLDAAAVGLVLYFLLAAQGLEFEAKHVRLIAITTGLMLVVYSWSDLFYRLRTRSLWQEAARLLHAWAIVLVLLTAIGYLTQTQGDFSRELMGLWAALAYGAQLTLHVCIRKSLHLLRRRGYNIRRALVVGCGAPLERYVRLINRNPWLGIRVEGYVAEQRWLTEQGGSAQHLTGSADVARIATESRDSHAQGNQPGIAGGRLRLLGGLADVEKLVDSLAINEIYVALPLERSADADLAVRALVNVPVNVNWLPDFSVAQVLSTRADMLDGQPTVLLSDSRIERHGRLVKRVEDIALSVLLIALLAPLMVAIAWAVRRSSPGPVLFKQQRLGLGGKRIVVLKFRTMSVDSKTETPRQASARDDRVTPIGRWLRRWSLDELPQLFNVLDGSMSLVGPRPHPLWLNGQFSRVVNAYMQRHRVKPGLTGWAQVNGYRGETDTPEKMELRLKHDLYYITHWSPWLDFKILVKTATAVVRGTNAY